jgi:AcrR family transcriptional regulator
MQPKTEKRDAILQAMLDLVVERGFHNSPMSLVAERSGASAGVIYHYFESKEAVIHALYERVKSMKHDMMLEGYSTAASPDVVFVKIFCNAYHFYRGRSKESRFLELYENSPFKESFELTGKQRAAVETQDRLLKLFGPKKSGGILKNLPADVIEELSLGLAARLAKKTEPLKPAMLRKVAATAWEALVADD